MVTLANGDWLMAFNDQENGRSDLTVAISDDDGQSWKWKKRIEHDERGEQATSAHYPSVIQDSNGRIHVIYSYHRHDTAPAKTIKYATFTTNWLKN